MLNEKQQEQYNSAIRRVYAANKELDKAREELDLAAFGLGGVSEEDFKMIRRLYSKIAKAQDQI